MKYHNNTVHLALALGLLLASGGCDNNKDPAGNNNNPAASKHDSHIDDGNSENTPNNPGTDSPDEQRQQDLDDRQQQDQQTDSVPKCPECGANGNCDENTGKCVCFGNYTGNTCEECKERFTGDDCEECQFPWVSVACNMCPTGLAGIACNYCAKGYYGTGTDCKPCQCDDPSKPYCDDGKDSTGDCYGCPEGFTGENCDQCRKGHYGPSCTKCLCENGSCNEGVDGDGSCSCKEGYTGQYCDSCEPDRYSVSCASCNCKNGSTCNDGITGNGKCTCQKDYFGKDCSQQCNCVNGTCDDGFTGGSTGKCTCQHGWTGTICNNCASGFTGDKCQECLPGYFGDNCLPCPTNCLSGMVCDDGRYGTGTCNCKNATISSSGSNKCDISCWWSAKTDSYDNSGDEKYCTLTHGGRTYNLVKTNGLLWTRQNLTYVDFGGTINAHNSEFDAYTYYTTFGLLYTYEAAQKACPDNWRLPTSAEAQSLLDTFKDKYYELVANDGTWKGFDITDDTDASGLNFQPGGYYWTLTKNGNEYFDDIGTRANFWLADGKILEFFYYTNTKKMSAHVFKSAIIDAASVRCVRK